MCHNEVAKEMMKIPMLGTAEKKESSKFQVTLVDKTNKTRINRFFDNIEDRNNFINLFESSILQSGGKFVHKVRLSHPLFESFDILDQHGNTKYEIVVYS